MTLKEIVSPIDKELKLFTEKFKDTLQSRVRIVDIVANYVVKQKGKKLRPMLVLLSSKACTDELPEETYRAAVTIELIHTATLVHDDVVDGADMRRGIPSINAVWKNKVAVLMGDYLLANALISIVSIKRFDAMMLLSEATRRASQGELLQIDKSKTLDLDEETYVQMISDKTGALIAAACQLGPITTTGDAGDIAAMREFGESIGIAFQIKDDLFDYIGKEKVIGKTKGRDLKESKITLPLIHSFQNVAKKESKAILKLIKNGGMTKKQVDFVIDFAKRNGGIEYATDRLNHYARRAIESLSALPDSEARSALRNFVIFNSDRNR